MRSNNTPVRFPVMRTGNGTALACPRRMTCSSQPWSQTVCLLVRPNPRGVARRSRGRVAGDPDVPPLGGRGPIFWSGDFAWLLVPPCPRVAGHSQPLTGLAHAPQPAETEPAHHQPTAPHSHVTRSSSGPERAPREGRHWSRTGASGHALDADPAYRRAVGCPAKLRHRLYGWAKMAPRATYGLARPRFRLSTDLSRSTESMRRWKTSGGSRCLISG